MAQNIFTHNRLRLFTLLSAPIGRWSVVNVCLVLLAVPACLLLPDSGRPVAIGVVAVTGLTMLLVVAAMGATTYIEQQRQRALGAFLMSIYPEEYFSVKAVRRLSVGGSITVADDGQQRYRLQLEEIESGGELLVSTPERSGKLFCQWICV